MLLFSSLVASEGSHFNIFPRSGGNLYQRILPFLDGIGLQIIYRLPASSFLSLTLPHRDTCISTMYYSQIRFLPSFRVPVGSELRARVWLLPYVLVFVGGSDEQTGLQTPIIIAIAVVAGVALIVVIGTYYSPLDRRVFWILV